MVDSIAALTVQMGDALQQEGRHVVPSRHRLWHLGQLCGAALPTSPPTKPVGTGIAQLAVPPIKSLTDWEKLPTL
jgi:hypothetical protein